jgi:hypothetical protein
MRRRGALDSVALDERGLLGPAATNRLLEGGAITRLIELYAPGSRMCSVVFLDLAQSASRASGLSVRVGRPRDHQLLGA